MTDIYFAKNNVHFTKTEKKLIDYIIASPHDFIRMSIGDVARCIGSSEPTVSRFARHCGYTDFKELKNAVLAHIAEDNPPAGKLSSTLGSESSATPEGFLRRQQYCIEKTLEFLDTDQLSHAADMILSADTVWIYSKGASVSMAELLRFRLNRFGKRVMPLPPGSSELFEHMNFFTEKDLVILFGFQKTPKEAGVILDHQKPLAIPAFSLPAGFTGRQIRKTSCPCSSFAANPPNITPWLPRLHCWMPWLLCLEPGLERIRPNSLTVCIN